MELLPEEELETSTQKGSDSFVDRRARKVLYLLVLKSLNFNTILQHAFA